MSDRFWVTERDGEIPDLDLWNGIREKGEKMPDFVRRVTSAQMQWVVGRNRHDIHHYVRTYRRINGWMPEYSTKVKV